MKTTITEYRATICHKCGGEGRIPQFSHRKGGECFACGGTGKGAPIPYEREMTDAEVFAALAEAGVTIIATERPETGDWLADLFMDENEVKGIAEGARMMLAAL